jgi:hypothetical protein
LRRGKGSDNDGYKLYAYGVDGKDGLLEVGMELA